MSTMDATAASRSDCWNRIGIWSPDGASCPELEQVTHCRNCPVYSAAGRRVLDREIPADYRRDWNHVYSREKASAAAAAHSVVLFRLGDEWMALANSLINEITEMKPIHRLPHFRTGVVKGLVNIRGELQICVSLGRLLGINKGEMPHGDHPATTFRRVIVVSRDNSRFVFPVSEVHGIYHHEPHELHSPPATLTKAAASYTRGVLNWQDKRVAVLDDEAMFTALSKSLA